MKKIELTDLHQYQYLSDVKFSPAGGIAAFVVKQANLSSNDYDSTLWLWENGAVRQLTATGRVGMYYWEDSEHIVFTANCGPAEEDLRKKRITNTSFFRISIHGGEAQPAFRLPLNLLSITRLKGNTFLIHARIDCAYPDYHKLTMEEREAIGQERQKEQDYHVLDEISFYSNGTGFTNKTRTALFLYDSGTGSLERITGPQMQVEWFTPWQGKIAFVGYEFQRKMSSYQNVYLYDLESKGTRCVYDAGGYRFFRIFPVGEKLVVRACEKDTKYSFNCWGNYHEVDVEGRCLRLFLENEIDMTDNVLTDSKLGGGSIVKAAGDRYYFVGTVRNDAALCVVSQDGAYREVFRQSGAINFFDIDPVSGIILASAMLDGLLPELYVLNPETQTARRDTHFNDAVLEGKYVARPQQFTFQSQGREIDGFVLLPIDYAPRKKYPAILDIHGGPKASYGDVFYHEMQVWASEGYFVFYCNPVGSDGRGHDFANIFGREGGEDYRNLMDFTDEVLSRYPAIDPTRVGVTGGSFGGYMTNWIIGHTDRFACAISQRSISNYISFYGTSDIYFAVWHQAGGTMYDNLEHIWNQSPLKYANQVKTPTLFIHSDEDYRCPLEQGLQMFTALTDQGVETRMCIIKGEHHGLSRVGRPTHRERRLREITNWMNQHLKAAEE